jgi:hypothetical protein
MPLPANLNFHFESLRMDEEVMIVEKKKHSQQEAIPEQKAFTVIDWYIKEPQEKKEILTQILGI